LKIDPTFLRQVQTAGWQIAGATETAIIAACPTDGCSVRVTFTAGQPVRFACKPSQNADCVVGSFDAGRNVMRKRRLELALTIKDVEDIAGIAVDFLAKFEKDNPSKIPNAQTFIEWAQALGYDVVLRRSTLPLYALRLIADTRPQAAARLRATARGQRALASDAPELKT